MDSVLVPRVKARVARYNGIVRRLVTPPGRRVPGESVPLTKRVPRGRSVGESVFALAGIQPQDPCADTPRCFPMNTPAPASLASSSPERSRRLRTRDRPFYLIITLVLIGLVIKGFWPSYYSNMLTGPVAPRPWVMHLHGAIFSGWMLLLLLQVVLVAVGRIAAHRRVGTLGIGYGLIVLGLGVVVSFTAPLAHIQAGEWTLNRGAGFMIYPLGDMILFGGFFGAAIAYRRNLEAHKRLMLAATVALAFAAVARMEFPSPAFLYLVWVSPLLAGVGYDLYSRRRVHPVYVISLVAMTIAFPRIWLEESEAWLKIGRALLTPFL